MRKTKEVLRLKFELGLGLREIARSCSLGLGTVHDYLQRAKGAGIAWPLPEGWGDEKLESALFGGAPPRAADITKAAPDFAAIHEQKQRHRHVTLQLLWEEYKQANPEGYGYSRFCELYQRWVNKLDLVLRQEHKPGEKMFVDWAGTTIPIHEPQGGPPGAGHLFVAVLGASSYTYAEATSDEQLTNWIGAHVRAFEFYQGVPALVIPDNTKTGVTKACRYDPDLNPTYQELATHYGVGVLPARQGSRFSLFEAIDRPVLRPLPLERFDLSQWSRARVNIDYHIAFDSNFYSVPYNLVHEVVEVRSTPTTIEILHKSQRVASHMRAHGHGKTVTVAEHRPKSHQAHLEWTPSRLVHWAQSIGPHTAGLCERILADKPHPEAGYRGCLGLMRLAKEYSPARMEAAAERALLTGACRYQSVKSILKNSLDLLPVTTDRSAPSPLSHDYIRGSEYFD